MTFYDDIIMKIENNNKLSDVEIKAIKDSLLSKDTVISLNLREQFLLESQFKYFIKNIDYYNILKNNPINSAVFCDFYSIYSLNYFNVNDFDICLLDTNNINYENYLKYNVELKENCLELKVFVENFLVACAELLNSKGTFIVTCNSQNLYMLYNLCVELLGEKNYIGTFSWEGIDNRNKYLNDTNQYSLLFTNRKHGYKYNKISARLESIELPYKKEYSYKNKYSQSADVYEELFTFFEKDIKILDVFGDYAEVPIAIDRLNKKDNGNRYFMSLICNNEKIPYTKKTKDNLNNIVFYDMGYTKDLNTLLNYSDNNFEYREDFEYHLKFNTIEKMDNNSMNISENNELILIILYESNVLQEIKNYIKNKEKKILIYPTNKYLKKSLNQDNYLKKYILNKIK